MMFSEESFAFIIKNQVDFVSRIQLKYAWYFRDQINKLMFGNYIEN
jgi:hypothetical protein